MNPVLCRVLTTIFDRRLIGLEMANDFALIVGGSELAGPRDDLLVASITHRTLGMSALKYTATSLEDAWQFAATIPPPPEVGADGMPVDITAAELWKAIARGLVDASHREVATRPEVGKASRAHLAKPSGEAP